MAVGNGKEEGRGMMEREGEKAGSALLHWVASQGALPLLSEVF